MVTLNTLRNKGGALLAFVIGLALVAFILGDVLSSGSSILSGSKMNVGQIDGETVTYLEYDRVVNQLMEVQRITTGRDGSSEEETEMIREQAWNQMIREKAFNPQIAKLGLSVSDQEMIDMVNGPNISPLIAEMFKNPQTGFFDPEYMRYIRQQAAYDETGRLMLFWNYVESETADQSLLFKYKALVDKAAYVTSLEARTIADLQSRTYSARYVVQKYADLADSSVNITDSELRGFFNNHKEMFRQDVSRDIEYVSFEALPSEEDYAEAEQKINSLAEELRNTSNVQQFISMNSQSAFDTRYYNEEQLVGELGNFALTASAGEIYGPVLSGDQWTIARVADVQSLPDSIRLSNITLPLGQQALADSLMGVLRAGGDFAELARNHSEDVQSAIIGGDIGSLDPQNLVPALASELKGAKTGEVKMVVMPDGIYILKVTESVRESDKIQLGILTYNVEPSSNTRNQAFANASRFATAVSTSGFDNAVAENSLSKRVATLGPNDRTVGGILQSRELVRWAFNGKKGDNSGVMEFGNYFVIAKVNDIRKAGTATFDQAKETVRTILLNRKKGELLADRMQGGSVESLASSLGTSVLQNDDINFEGFMAPEVGLDPSFPGGVAALSQSGQASKPIVGRIGVYVAQADDIRTEEGNPELQKARLTAEGQQVAFPVAYQSFLELLNIEDVRYRFY